MKDKCFISYKKGSDKVLSVYWFAIIILVGIGIFGMVYVYYSAPYDVREAEAKILSDKLGDCISRNGMINPSFLSKNEINVMEVCSLNFHVEDEVGFQEEEQYFFEIEMFEIGKESSKKVFSGGNLNWKGDCFIEDKKGKEYKNLVKCSEERIYAGDGAANQYLIKIISGVGKSEKNIKQ
jgi:hypothetical protein